MRLAAENTLDCLVGMSPLLDERNLCEDDAPLKRNLTLPVDCRSATLLTRAIAGSLPEPASARRTSSPRA